MTRPLMGLTALPAFATAGWELGTNSAAEVAAGTVPLDGELLDGNLAAEDSGALAAGALAAGALAAGALASVVHGAVTVTVTVSGLHSAEDEGRALSAAEVGGRADSAAEVAGGAASGAEVAGVGADSGADSGAEVAGTPSLSLGEAEGLVDIVFVRVKVVADETV